MNTAGKVSIMIAAGLMAVSPLVAAFPAPADMTRAEAADKGFPVPAAKRKAADQHLRDDVEVNLADGFVALPGKAAQIANTIAHMAKGEVRRAQHLLGHRKYYEATPALKAVGDGVIVDSYGLDSLPVQS